MELADLEVFLAVVNEGGISRAAQVLHRVPSNVTARIQKLEQSLGKSLFSRENNRLRISSNGEQLVEYAERILALADEAKQAFTEHAPHGGLKVGSMECTAATHLAAPLTAYHQSYPQVNLQVKTGPTGKLIDDVLNGELDVAMVADPLIDSRLMIKAIYKEDLVLVSDRRRAVIRSPSDLGPEPKVLGFGLQCAYRLRLAEWLKQGAVTANVIEISSYHAMLSCAAAGMGVGLLPKSLLEHYPLRDTLKEHSLPAKWRRTTTALIWRKDRTNINVEAFVRAALENQ